MIFKRGTALAAAALLVALGAGCASGSRLPSENTYRVEQKGHKVDVTSHLEFFLKDPESAKIAVKNKVQIKDVLEEALDEGNVQPEKVPLLTERGLFSPHRYPIPVLESLLEKRDAAKPTWGIVGANTDYNDAFAIDHDLYTALHEEGINLDITERRTDREVADTVVKLGEQEGYIPTVLLAGHGQKTSIHYRNTPGSRAAAFAVGSLPLIATGVGFFAMPIMIDIMEDPDFVDTEDTEELARLAPYMTQGNRIGTISPFACLTAKGDENLCQVISYTTGARTIGATDVIRRMDTLYINQTGELLHATYENNKKGEEGKEKEGKEKEMVPVPTRTFINGRETQWNKNDYKITSERTVGKVTIYRVRKKAA